MKKHRLVLLILFHSTAAVFAQQRSGEARLWYRQPAAIWEDALPVGNGRIGAMVFGNTDSERIQINEASLWGGTKLNSDNPGAREYLDSVRKLVFANKIDEAYVLAQQHLLAIPPTVRPYQHFMNCFITYPHDDIISDYKRELDIINGVATTSYLRNGSLFTEKVFSSSAANILVVRIESSRKAGIQCLLQLDRTQDAHAAASGNYIRLQGQIIDTASEAMGPGGPHMRFAGILKLVNSGGMVKVTGNQLEVKGADTLTLYINASTDYDPEKMALNAGADPALSCLKGVQKQEHVGYHSIYMKHVNAYQHMMNRMSVFFGGDEKNILPTDMRLESVRKGSPDPALDALFFQYGRYLLYSAAGPRAVLPPNLQGIWCYQYDPKWRSDFHTNINLQMNYWPAEVCNLSETTKPLFDFLNRIRENGRITARKTYGVNGWVIHHNTSPFGETSIRDGAFAGMYPIATGWMCLHEWEHYLFTRNRKFLSGTAYPIMKEAAGFLKDILVRSPEGYLVIVPSYSPENSFIHPITGKPTRMTYGVTMDVQILKEFFNACIRAGTALKKDRRFLDSLADVLKQLPPIKINGYGGVQEWIEDYKEFEPGHRHMSHLFGLYPGTTINRKTPQLFEAAKKTLEHRLSSGGGHTGWSRAWIINFYARLLEPEQAYKHLQLLLQKSTLKNLFDDHPPFQIDGNFGATAGIAEMLIQSHGDNIELLPALPAAWKTGSIKGICARGGFVFNMHWGNGKLVKAGLLSRMGGRCRVKYGKKLVIINTSPGKSYQLDGLL